MAVCTSGEDTPDSSRTPFKRNSARWARLNEAATCRNPGFSHMAFKGVPLALKGGLCIRGLKRSFIISSTQASEVALLTEFLAGSTATFGGQEGKLKRQKHCGAASQSSGALGQKQPRSTAAARGIATLIATLWFPLVQGCGKWPLLRYNRKGFLTKGEIPLHHKSGDKPPDPTTLL